MKHNILINKTIERLKLLPEEKIRAVETYIDFLLAQVIDESSLQDDIQKLVSETDAFKFLETDEELYSLTDLKETF